MGRLPVRLALCQGGTWCPGDVGARVTKRAASTETDEQHVALRGASISSNYGDTATEVKGPFLTPCGCLSLSSTISVPVRLISRLLESLRPASALLTITVETQIEFGATFHDEPNSSLNCFAECRMSFDTSVINMSWHVNMHFTSGRPLSFGERSKHKPINNLMPSCKWNPFVYILYTF